jgi:hypothetical protein
VPEPAPFRATWRLPVQRPSCYIHWNRSGEGPWCKTQESPRRVRRPRSRGSRPAPTHPPRPLPPLRVKTSPPRQSPPRPNPSPVRRPPGKAAPLATTPETPPVIPLQPPPGIVGVPPAAPPAAEPFRIGSILIPALYLVGILVLGAIILAWLKRRRVSDDLAPSTTASEQLATFRHAYEDGEMTPEEFQKVKARLSEKLRDRDPMSMPPQAKRRRDGEPPSGLPGDDTA